MYDDLEHYLRSTVPDTQDPFPSEGVEDVCPRCGYNLNNPDTGTCLSEYGVSCLSLHFILKVVRAVENDERIDPALRREITVSLLAEMGKRERGLAIRDLLEILEARDELE